MILCETCVNNCGFSADVVTRIEERMICDICQGVFSTGCNVPIANPVMNAIVTSERQRIIRQRAADHAIAQPIMVTQLGVDLGQSPRINIPADGEDDDDDDDDDHNDPFVHNTSNFCFRCVSCGDDSCDLNYSCTQYGRATVTDDGEIEDYQENDTDSYIYTCRECGTEYCSSDTEESYNAWRTWMERRNNPNAAANQPVRMPLPENLGEHFSVADLLTVRQSN